MKPRAQQPDSRHNGAAQFVTTHWSLILAGGWGEADEAQAALEKLCRTYWPPLYAYARRRAADVHEAQDLTQSFFARFLEKGYLQQAAAERGRFRAFLITAFKHFLAKEWDRMKAKKRGGGRVPFSLDFATQESAGWGDPGHEVTAEHIYERQWAVTLLNHVMCRLQREMERSRKGGQFQALMDYLIGHARGYAAVAAELGLTEPAARMAASRLRNRYRELLREEIAQTVDSPQEIEDEIGHLFGILAK